MEKDAIVNLLSKSNLNINVEEEAFQAAANWIDYDLSTRKVDMYDLLAHVRLPLLPIGFLKDVVKVFPACKNSLRCLTMIDNAIAYQERSVESTLRFPLELVTPRCWKSGTVYVVQITPFFKIKYVKRKIAGTTPTRTYAIRKRIPKLNVKLTVFKNSPFKNSIKSKMFSIEKSVFGFTAVSLNENIYITGGAAYCYHGLDSLTSVQVCSTTTNSSYIEPSMNCDRFIHASCYHKGELYVLGGVSVFKPDQFFLKSCEAFNPETKTWKMIKDMNKPHFNFAAVSCCGFLYALGGFEYFRLDSGYFRSPRYCESSSYLDNLKYSVFANNERYDVSRNAWEVTTPMLVARYDHEAVSFNKQIFVCGGRNAKAETLNSCEVFDVETNQFTMLSPMNKPRCNFGITINSCNYYQCKIYCFGGYNGGTAEVYDNISNTWSELEGVEYEHSGCKSVTIF